jgi:hypothetical protein
MGWVIAMGISVFGGVAPCAVPRGMVALALLPVPFRGRLGPMTMALASVRQRLRSLDRLQAQGRLSLDL